MASPHVAGICALLKSYDKTLTPAQIENLINEKDTDFSVLSVYKAACILLGSQVKTEAKEQRFS